MLTLITTFKCSSACVNCCFECNQNREEKISYDDAERYIIESLAAFNSIKVVVLTGGESFLDLPFLIKLIKLINNYGLICRVVTNGFWAKSYENAVRILKLCKEAGLNEINYSTGDEHLEFVPLESVVNGIKAALDLDLITVVNIESAEESNFKMYDLIKNEELKPYISSNKARMLKFTNGIWMPFTQEGLKSLPKLDKEISHPCKQRCTNLFSAITISPTNKLYACCGLPVKYIPYLNLGDLYIHEIGTLYKKQFDDFMKIWLFVEGPYCILRFLEEKLGYEIPECRVLSHSCFYCACLFTNKQYLSAAKIYYRDRYYAVMLKFSFLIKQMNNIKK